MFEPGRNRLDAKKQVPHKMRACFFLLSSGVFPHKDHLFRQLLLKFLVGQEVQGGSHHGLDGLQVLTVGQRGVHMLEEGLLYTLPERSRRNYTVMLNVLHVKWEKVDELGLLRT